MSVYEHDDRGLRIIGFNEGVFFYDPNRTLACELYLRSDGVLASNCAIVGSVGAGSAPTEFVRLDGKNWASWLPSGGTQSVVGSFNLQGAAFQYKITGRHALSMPGTGNLLAGEGAGAVLTTGADNVIAGCNAGAALTNNAENVIVGSGAGVASGYLDDVVLIGYAAMSEADSVGGYNSVVIGDNSGGAAEIMDSVVIGSTALRDATAAAYSSADVIIGGGAVIGGANPYEGDYNVIVGAQAAPNLEDADSNVLAGYGAARAATTASRNVVVGTEAGEDMLDAWVNVILGWRTGYQLTNGDYNTLVGARAGTALTTGATVTMVGYESGLNATGNGSVFLGHQAGYYETGSNKLFIDNAKRASEADGRVKALLYGVFAAATADQYLTVNGHLTVLEDAIVGGTTAAARLHVNQNSATGAAPVLLLDQADVSEEFVRFVGTAADDTLTQSIVAVADVSTATVAGYVKVYVVDTGDQITDQAYYMPIYTLA